MAISTLAGANSGLKPPYYFRKVGTAMEAANIFHSYFYSTGEPAAAAVPSPGINGAPLTTYAGQIPFNNPSAGNSYLSRFICQSFGNVGIGPLFLFDRLWHNSGLVVTTTTEQLIVSGAMPARDFSATTNGVDLMVAIEVSTATTNVAPVTTTTLNYTNAVGTAGRVGTITSFPLTAAAGTFVPFELQAGDTGVRSIQGITLGVSYVTGAIHLVVYRALDMMALALAPGHLSGSFIPSVPVNNRRVQYPGRDLFSSGFVRMFDSTVPFMVGVATGTTATDLRAGIFEVAQG